MDPKIAARFNSKRLQEAMQRYNIAPENITELDGFESFIYKFQRPDGRFILRIGHSQRRSPELIHGEVDWINFLAAGGASVARAIHSANGELVEALDDGHGQQFLCSAFVEAPGRHIRREQVNDAFIHNYGRLLGKMHALAKNYQPANPAWRRYNWDAPINNTAQNQMPARETVALAKYQQVFEHLSGLPRDPEGFGLIHQDAHPGNFFVDTQNNLTLFDFDDCAYGHFIYDIAMVLFYTANEEPDPVAHTARFMPTFLAGYREENRLDPRWLAELPNFIKLREIDLFAAIHFSFEDGDNPDHPWCARYMKNRRERIETDQPFIDYNWASLSKSL